MRQRRSALRPHEVPDLGPVLDFLRTIWELDHALHRASKRMLRTKGVTAPQRLVLRIVGRFPSLQAGALAHILHVHPSTLTGVLARLQARGLLVRRTDPRDGRLVRLALTHAGRRVDRDHAGTLEAAVRRALRSLPDRSVQATRQVLAHITRVIEEEPRLR